jgi:hypothetical protein
VVYLAAVLGLAGWGWHDHSALSAQPVQASASCAAAAAPKTGQAPAQLTTHGTQATTIAFGRDLTTHSRVFEFDATDQARLLTEGSCVRARVGDFLRDGTEPGGGQLNADDVNAFAQVRDGGVLLTVTMTRADTAFGPAGLYTGTVSLDDPRIKRVDIPLTVSLAYPVWQLPLVVLLLVLPVAVTYLWLVKGSFHGVALSRLTLAGFDSYAFSRNGIMAIGAGAASATAVFAALGALFAAFATASTPVTAAGADASGTNPADGRTGESGSSAATR